MSLCVYCLNLDLPAAFQKEVGSNQQRSLTSIIEGAPSCQFCAALLAIIESEKQLPQGDGSSGVTVKLILEGYAEALSQPSGEPIPPEGIARYGAVVVPITRLGLHLTRSGERDVFLDTSIQIKASSPTDASRSNLGRGRAVGEKVDYVRLATWMRRCTERHGPTCIPRKYGSDAAKLVLRAFDVQSGCIVELPRDASYAALSYVWGGVQQLRLLKHNYPLLTCPGALDSRVKEIPQTIRDAMHLSKCLQMQYLWVDSLCIIQDDEDDLCQQIPNMHVVYGSASITVVAASGRDADAGLPGVSQAARKACPLDSVIQGVPVIAGYPFFHSSMHSSIWETRGWTFQEKVLSKRLLIFTEHQAFFHCSSASWSEDAVWENDDPFVQLSIAVQLQTPYHQNASIPSLNFKGMDKYFHLVSGYHPRSLSNESDAVDAFSGVFSDLRQEMATEFFWGTPCAFFNQALQWKTSIHDPGLRRGEFPSWSWLGWKATALPGDFTWPTRLGNHVATESLVRWHRVGSSGSIEHLNTDGESRHGEPLTASDLGLSLGSLTATDQLLCFRAETIWLAIGQASTKTTIFSRFGTQNYGFGPRDGADGPVRAIGELPLHRQWAESLGDAPELEFVILGRSWFRSLYESNVVDECLDLVAVETREGVSYRVQVPSTKVDASWYPVLYKRRRVVLLG
ncbi:heterokaryon incompatibility protein-domain-containing protein [Stachybotrys elegans]|uniref:Heterokaryon incompatibility protein-domain-containing protein n=1 Tax=Stachybotrys elegans TaxID=80388 RepID=A0A8K0SQL7_9HYPO|nr:heterokaryon incompatibility protein-domain-containing protein [Stachybotrys elegans]